MYLVKGNRTSGRIIGKSMYIPRATRRTRGRVRNSEREKKDSVWEDCGEKRVFRKQIIIIRIYGAKQRGQRSDSYIGIRISRNFGILLLKPNAYTPTRLFVAATR